MVVMCSVRGCKNLASWVRVSAADTDLDAYLCTSHLLKIDSERWGGQALYEPMDTSDQAPPSNGDNGSRRKKSA